MNDYQLFNFEYDQIINHADSFKDDVDQINYLEYVSKENRIRNCTCEGWKDGHFMELERKILEELNYRRQKSLNQSIYGVKIIYDHTYNAASYESKPNNQIIKNSNKIKWQGTEGQLIYLVKSLVKKEFLSKEIGEQPVAFIKKHFVNKDGKNFKNKQLSQSHYQYSISSSEKPKRAEQINKMIENIT